MRRSDLIIAQNHARISAALAMLREITTNAAGDADGIDFRDLRQITDTLERWRMRYEQRPEWPLNR